MAAWTGVSRPALRHMGSQEIDRHSAAVTAHASRVQCQLTFLAWRAPPLSSGTVIHRGFATAVSAAAHSSCRTDRLCTREYYRWSRVGEFLENNFDSTASAAGGMSFVARVALQLLRVCHLPVTRRLLMIQVKRIPRYSEENAHCLCTHTSRSSKLKWWNWRKSTFSRFTRFSAGKIFLLIDFSRWFEFEICWHDLNVCFVLSSWRFDGVAWLWNSNEVSCVTMKNVCRRCCDEIFVIDKAGIAEGIYTKLMVEK